MTPGICCGQPARLVLRNGGAAIAGSGSMHAGAAMVEIGIGVSKPRSTCSPSGRHGPGHRGGEGRGGEERRAELLCQILHPHHHIDRRPDQRELQALGHADIAVDDLAEMERDAEVERGAVLGRRRRAEPPPRFVRRGKRAAAGLLRRASRRGTGRAPRRRSARRLRRHGRARRPPSFRNSGRGN